MSEQLLYAPTGYELTVEVAFESDANLSAADATWTDVTQYVRGTVSISRGRQTELDATQPGTLSLTLDNSDRRFDTFNTAGPYYPYVEPMKQVQVHCNGLTMFYGYVDSWAQAWDDPDATVSLTATDILKVFAKVSLKQNPWEMTQLSVPPVLRYAMRATGYTTEEADLGSDGTHPGHWLGTTVTYGVDGLVQEPGDDKAVTFPKAGGCALTPTNAARLPTFPFSVSFVFRKTMDSTDYAYLMSVYDENAAEQLIFNVYVNPTTGYLTSQLRHWDVATSTSADKSVTSTVSVADGQRHQVTLMFPSSTPSTWKMYVDGSDVGNTLSGTWTYGVPQGRVYYYIGNHSLLGSTQGFNGTVDDVSVYDTALTATDAQWLTEAMRGWSTLTSGERITRLLTLTGFVNKLGTIDDGNSTPGSPNLSGSLLDYLRLVAESEQGVLRIEADTVCFDERHTRLKNIGTLLATFGDGGGSELPYTNLVLAPSDIHIRNQVTVQRNGGTPQTVSDEDSKTRYLLNGYSVSGLLLQEDSEAKGMAQYLLGKYAQPLQRIDALTFELGGQTETDAYDVALSVSGSGYTDVIKVIRRPPGGGADIETTAYVESVQHEISIDGWKVTWRLSPADTTPFLVLDSLVLGLLDTARLAY